MPEGDTIARAAAVLHQALAGQVVTAFTAALAPVAAAHETHPLPGRTVDRVTAHGKHLVMAFSGGVVLRSHMRMHGAWHLYTPGERWLTSPRAARLRLDTAPWVAVAFHVYDAELAGAADARALPVVAALGPDLLAPTVDVPAVAARLVGEGPRPIADVLLDQRVVAGIGNVFRSEVLFLEGLDPRGEAGRLTPEAADALVRRAVRLLGLNARPGAGRRVTTGRQHPGDALWVYQRTGRPCRRCGTPIESYADLPLARRVYWCPACQAGTLTADRPSVGS
jgi:endonuclease-8